MLYFGSILGMWKAYGMDTVFLEPGANIVLLKKSKSNNIIIIVFI